ncbi:UBP-type zinc finger domain-containing protein [Streptomyces sp. NPDC017254]|uniref:UBP-type zinc finger domain-containing protein n=1 Tax=unclassified Streptomyces TaxID=2593676 RepID=UPI0037AF81E6
MPRPSWTAARDGGRPERTDGCAHAATVPAAPEAPADGCAECLASGGRWRRLRWCATCGHVGCCDSSRGRHAYAHHERTGHPVVLSLAKDEDWAWCFADEVFLVRETPGDDTERGSGP